MSKFNIGDKVSSTFHGEGTVLALHDKWVWALFKDGPFTHEEEVLKPAPKRYVVEHRRPKLGERFFSSSSDEIRTRRSSDFYAVRPVIVEEL